MHDYITYFTTSVQWTIEIIKKIASEAHLVQSQLIIIPGHI